MSTVESSARGRDANTAYLYERIAEGDHEHAEQPDSPHVMRRGTSHDAAQLVRGIIAARDDRATHRPPGRRKHRPRGGSPRPGTQPLRPPRPRRSIQTDGLPALARGNPGDWWPSGSAGSTNTSVATAAKIRASTTASTSSRSGVRPHGRWTVGRRFPVFGRGRNGLWSRLLRSRSETTMRSVRPGWVMVGMTLLPRHRASWADRDGLVRG